LALGIPREKLEEIFADVSLAAEAELENVNPWARQFRVFVCGRPKLDLRQVWTRTSPRRLLFENVAFR
jgi:hypothetical protein